MTQKITEYLEKVGELESKATPGPWKPTEKEVDISLLKLQKILVTEHGVDGPHAFVSHQGHAEAKCDAEFIASSRTLIPNLREALSVAVDVLNKFDTKINWPDPYVRRDTHEALAKIERILGEK